jgi:hypothetical protein
MCDLSNAMILDRIAGPPLFPPRQSPVIHTVVIG